MKGARGQGQETGARDRGQGQEKDNYKFNEMVFAEGGIALRRPRPRD